MSQYIRLLNTIKERATAAWLTDRQRVVFDGILARWLSLPFVNVWGAPGCGKSFVAQILVKTHNYVYKRDLQSLKEKATNVVVDDAHYTRLMRVEAREQDLGRIILLTERPISDPMPKIELRLEERDVNQCLHNLHAYCQIELFKQGPRGTDLGQIIRAEMVARGGSDVD